MPKSGSNARPYNRDQKAGGKTRMRDGQRRAFGSGQDAQMLRGMAAEDQDALKIKIRTPHGKKPTEKKAKGGSVAPTKSPRPKARPFKDVSPSAEEGDQEWVKPKGGKSFKGPKPDKTTGPLSRTAKPSTKKYAKGGRVRGTGCATSGTGFNGKY